MDEIMAFKLEENAARGERKIKRKSPNLSHLLALQLTEHEALYPTEMGGRA